MKFEPWETYKDVPPRRIIEITAPPCPFCRFWDPVVNYIGRTYNGITLCHSSERYADFSCFKECETDAKTTH